jgi:hypothetical protein
MPSIIALALTIFLGGFGYLEYSRYDPADSGNISAINAKIVAENAFLFTGLLFQYAESHPTTQLVAAGSLLSYSTAGAQPLLNYQSVIYVYKGQPYILNSWDSSNKPGVAINDVFGELSGLVNKRIYQSNDTFWQIPVVGVNNNCSLSRYSYIDPLKATATLALFSTICNLVNAQFPVKRFVIFEQVVLSK